MYTHSLANCKSGKSHSGTRKSALWKKSGQVYISWRRQCRDWRTYVSIMPLSYISSHELFEQNAPRVC